MNFNAGGSTAMNGMAVGSLFGAKGAAIGAGVGLLAGLFSADRDRKSVV